MPVKHLRLKVGLLVLAAAIASGGAVAGLIWMNGLPADAPANVVDAARSKTNVLPNREDAGNKPAIMPEWQRLWVADFKGNRVLGFNRQGVEVWQQHMASPPLMPKSFNTHAEYVTVAPNGNLIVADGEGMMVQEIDQQSHTVVWQYGVKDKQGAADGLLHQPDKAYKINDFEVLVNDGNNRRVIIIDQRTNKIVWQYGATLRMGSTPGLLRGNTCAVPLAGGRQIAIVDTLDKKIIVVDRATKNVVWEWTKKDAKWLQHASPTTQGGFVMEDRQKNEVFEVNSAGQIVWRLDKLADGSRLRYPTDVKALPNGNVLIAEAGRARVIEVMPATGAVVSTFNGVGFVTTVEVQ